MQHRIKVSPIFYIDLLRLRSWSHRNGALDRAAERSHTAVAGLGGDAHGVGHGSRVSSPES
jgi:hypothetical protein